MTAEEYSKLTPIEKEYDKKVDEIIKVMEDIPLHKVSILTGKNGTGKSMIRKHIRQFLVQRDELKDKKDKSLIASTSMDDRAGVDPCRMMVFSRDCEWLPTGENTLRDVQGCMMIKNHFVILDEIELGVGEELQAGLAKWISEHEDEALANGLGILIITHSRTIVRGVKHDCFFNLDGMTEEEWLNREITPESVDDFKQRSDNLYRAFQKRLKKG